MTPMHFKQAPFLLIPTIGIDIKKEVLANGDIILQSTEPLQERPHRMTARLEYWAKFCPEKIFLAQKKSAGTWESINYLDTLRKIRNIAQWIIQQGASTERPIAILSENCIEHALVAIAAMHIGVPFSSITPAYALKATDYKKLRFVFDQLTPSLVVVSDGAKYENALNQVFENGEVVYFKNKPEGNFSSTSLSELYQTEPTEEIDRRHFYIESETIAKILFTSGSTGQPKGVINTHGNITSNWQQIVQVFPFMKDGFTLIDWLPWNHTFGGNHNLGLTLFNGGSLYIDGGSATPEGFKTTLENLAEIQPDIYFNVPAGFDLLVQALRKDIQLRDKFFSKLKLLFYAGAGMSQQTWDALEELAYLSTGHRLLISTGLGCTESSPSAMFNTHFGSFSGMLGVPVPGLKLKLVDSNGKLQAHYKGANVMPGYWRNPQANAAAFDDEGYYKTGDALKFVNPDEPNEGMIFDGRIAEDFKLNSGTWVSVGNLRNDLIKEGDGLIQDVVITGHDRSFIGAIVFLNSAYLKNHFNLELTEKDPISNNELGERMRAILNSLAQKSTGSSTLIKRALIATFPLSANKNEITDKGTINQSAVLKERSSLVQMLYLEPPDGIIIEISEKT